MYRIIILLMVSILIFDCHTNYMYAAEEDITIQTSPNERGILRNSVTVLNVGILSFIGYIGIFQWDWGKQGVEMADEGWFSHNTKYGGADKLGHFYGHYLISDLVYLDLTINHDVSRSQAAIIGAGMGFIVGTLIEIGDGTSTDYGFSTRDLIADTVGVLTSYILNIYPDLKSKIKIKFETKYSNFNIFKSERLFDDYENNKYILALSLAGFKGLEHSPFRFIDLYVSYYTRRYSKEYAHYSSNRRNVVEYGIALNVSEVYALFRDKKHLDYKIVNTIDNYFRLPNTYAGIEYINDVQK